MPMLYDANVHTDINLEGTMADVREIDKTYSKNFKQKMKEAKMSKKSGDYDDAIKSFNEAKTILGKIESASKKVSDPDFMEYLKSMLLWSLIVNPIIAAAITSVRVGDARKRLESFVKRQRSIIDIEIEECKDLKKFSK